MIRAWAVFVVLAPLAAAHTFHASIAQIDYISSKKTLEIIVWIHAEDIERRMRDQLGANATLDDRRQAEGFVKEYLKGHFELKRSTGAPLALQWVGLEVRTHFLAAYLEAPAPNGMLDLTLTNRILLAYLPDQTNTVKIKQDGEEERELLFDNRGSARAQRLMELKPRL